MSQELKPIATGSSREATTFLSRWEEEGGARSLPWGLDANNETLTQKLIAAAGRIGDMPPDEVASLMLQAAIRLQAPTPTDARLEHIPVHAYHLLRRLSQQPLTMHSLHAADDKAAAEFLLSHGLAVKSDDKLMLRGTQTGREVGQIAEEV